jgi:hypothetical protein
VIGRMPVGRFEEICNLREGECRRAVRNVSRSGVRRFLRGARWFISGLTAKAQYGGGSCSDVAFVGVIWFCVSGFCALPGPETHIGLLSQELSS